MHFDKLNLSASEQLKLFPLTVGQRDLWIGEILDPDRELYTVCFVLELLGKIELDLMEKALRQIVGENDAHRLKFVNTNDGPRQSFGFIDDFHIPVLNFSHEQNPRSAAITWMKVDRAKPFDIANGPLFRYALIRIADDRFFVYLAAHHLMIDWFGWSLLLRRLSTVYGGLIARNDPPPSDYVSVLELVDEDAAYHHSDLRTQDRNYWLERLANRPQAVTLSGHSPHLRGVMHRSEAIVPAATVALLEQLGAANGVSLPAVIIAAVAIYQARMTGASDVILGMPVGGRPRTSPTMRRVIGFAVNTVPLRVAVELNESIGAFLRQVAQRVREAVIHQRYWDSDLRNDLGVTPDQPALYGTVINLTPADDDFDFAGVPIRKHNLINYQSEDFYIVAQFGSPADDLRFDLKGNERHFDENAVKTHQCRFLQLIDELAASADRFDQPLHRLDLLPSAEHARLTDWNATAALYCDDKTFVQLFEAQAAASPAAVAISFQGDITRYGELNARANGVAHALRALGVGPGSVVGISAPRSPALLAALIGIQKSGGAYVPLDPGFPPERLAYMLADSGAKVLVTVGDGAAGIEVPEGVAILDLNTLSQAGSPDNPAIAAGPGDTAYVIYTSGSTGRPKGVAVPHRAVMNFLWSMRHKPGLSASDIVAAVTTISFDIAVLELYLPLLTGARIELVPRETATDGAALADLLNTSGATVLQATPATWRLLVEAGWRGNPGFRALCGGEALPRDLADAILDRVGELWNLYGPTETTVWSTVDRVEGGNAPISIGKPIGNTTIHILDQAGEMVPIGVAGEIHIGGLGVATGYHQRPSLTAERFIPDRFSDRPGARLYRTGDLGRWGEDGKIYHLGRLDHQVKIRGFRIELGEIEARLGEHPGIREAVVNAREDSSGSKRLVGYFVSESNIAAEMLRVHLAAVLPDYMVPSAYVRLDSLPLTPNGKLDRNALPAPEHSTSNSSTYVAPRTPTEEILADIWAQILGLDRVGIDENFFELGGHSLLAMQMISRVRQALSIELRPSALFATPTIASLAARTHGASEALLPQIVPAPQDKYLPFPLTDIQEAYWAGQGATFDLGNIATHVYLEFDYTDLDIARLGRAWQRLTERHDMLRAIVLPNGQQQILKEVPPSEIEVLDLRGQKAQATLSRLEELRRQMSHPLVRSDSRPRFEIRASRINDHHVRLHFSRDVLMVDAWSAAIFHRELWQLYHQPDAALPALEISFRDYVLAELALHDTDLYRRSHDYWWDRIPTLPPAPELPLAKDPSFIKSPQFTRRSTRLEPAIWKSLKKKAAGAGLTSAGLLLAAFVDVLRIWSKNPRFTVNLTLFNRLPFHPQVNDLVGDMTSLSLLAVEEPAADDFGTRARGLQKQLWSDLDHRFVSGVAIMRELAKRQRNMRGGIMPVIFTSVIGQSLEPQETLSEKFIDGLTQTPQVWLDPQIFEDAGALIIAWDAVEELFPAGLLDDMFDGYCRLLRRLIDDEATWRETWSETARKIVPTRQFEQRAAINDTGRPTTDDLLHTLFAKQVPQRLRQTAVISSNRTLTYEELYQQSNRIGNWLRNKGATRNTLVAVVMEKGWEQVAGVLGVLASGAAYLPIDATLPKDRLWHLLEHGKVKFVLTQSTFDKSLEWPETVQRLIIDDNNLAALDDKPLAPVQTPDDLAYVIYTSGSTGLPKGVMIDHRGAVNTIIDLNQRFNMKADDRVLALSSLSFDLSVYDIFGMLAAGGTIVVPDAAGLRDPVHWADLVERYRVTLWNSVPALVQMLVEYLEGRGRLLPPNLRLVFMSGDWIPVALPTQIRTLTDSVEIISMGGATEASIWSIIYPIPSVESSWKSIPYGKPMVNQTFHVLNDVLEPCPVWVPGQLYIGGIGLAKGYWHDEAKTHASFIDHPKTGERLYRTGDQGRYLPDGNIEFLGRDDFQVKIQGYRVELEEISAVLGQHPAVRNSVVTAIGPAFGNKRLVAYVVLASASPSTVSELTTFLKERLPHYMLPTTFVTLEHFPLSPNGKVNRQALPEPVAPDRGRAETSPAEQTEQSARIAALVAAVLEVQHIEPDENLFDLGATSIGMIKIANSIERELDFRPKIEDLYRLPTVADLVELYQQHVIQKSFSQHADIIDAENGYEEGTL